MAATGLLLAIVAICLPSTKMPTFSAGRDVNFGNSYGGDQVAGDKIEVHPGLSKEQLPPGEKIATSKEVQVGFKTLQEEIVKLQNSNPGSVIFGVTPQAIVPPPPNEPRQISAIGEYGRLTTEQAMQRAKFLKDMPGGDVRVNWNTGYVLALTPEKVTFVLPDIYLDSYTYLNTYVTFGRDQPYALRPFGAQHRVVLQAIKQEQGYVVIRVQIVPT